MHAAQCSHALSPLQLWALRAYKGSQAGGKSGPPSLCPGFRPLGPIRGVVWLAMYKFSFGAVAWAAMMYLFLSEFTNILA